MKVHCWIAQSVVMEPEQVVLDQYSHVVPHGGQLVDIPRFAVEHPKKNMDIARYGETSPHTFAVHLDMDSLV